MRYEFFYSDNNIFWNNESENKPSWDYFVELMSWHPLKKQIRYTSQTTAEMIGDQFVEISMIKVVDTIGAHAIRYYYVSSFDKETEFTIKYNLTLDLWTTHIVHFLDTLYNTKVSYIRSHLRNTNAFQLSDNLLNQIPITYKKKIYNQYVYPYNDIGEYAEYVIPPFTGITSRLLEVKKSDAINGNVCYVFSGGLDTTNNEFTFIPILAKENGLKYEETAQSAGGIVGTVEFTLNADITLAQSQYERLKTDNPSAIITFSLQQIPPNAMPSWFNIDISTENSYRTSGYNPTMYFGTSTTVQTVYVNGSLITTLRTGATYGPSQSLVYPPFPRGTPIVITFYSPTGTPIKSTVYPRNYLVDINALKDNPNLISKFVGVFFMPNVLSFHRTLRFSNVGNFKNMLYFTINPNGVIIDQLRLSAFPIVNKKDTYDSIEINNDIILKYYDISYYNNHKDNWNYWLVDNQIVLSGLFIFNGCPSLMCQLPNLKVKDSIISYPYQLPSSTDEYIKYYSGIMSSIDNGIKQQEISYNLNKAQTGLNFMNGLNSFASNPSAMGGVNLGANTFMGIARNEQQNNAFKANLSAKFEDVKRTTGTNFAPSNVIDAAQILSNFNFGPNAETLELWVPDDNSLRLLNNVLYAYGTLYPDSRYYKELLQRESFNYIQFDKTWLATWLSLDGWITRFTLNIKNAILESLSSGIRIWKVYPANNAHN